MNDEYDKFLSVKQIVNDPDLPFTNGQLRDHLNKRKANGLGGYTVRIGKRIYIKKSDLIEWISSKKEEFLDKNEVE